jgi:hypothetical protein
MSHIYVFQLTWSFQPHYGPGIDSVTEMSARKLPGGKGRSARTADNLTDIYEPTLENVGASTSHNSMGLHGLLQE